MHKPLMPAVSPDVRALLDKQACAELVFRLARAIDRRDEALMRSVFHDGATDDHGLFAGTAAAFVDWVLPLLATMTRTQHLIGQCLIEAAGDTARGESYFTAHHALAGQNGTDRVTIAAGRYLDRFERRLGVWRIAHRHAVYDWSSAGPSTDAWDRAHPAGWAFGVAGPDDPSYRHFGRQRPAALRPEAD